MSTPNPKILVAARDLIARPNGWCQRSYTEGYQGKPRDYVGDCPVCIAGALAIARKANCFVDGEDCAEAKLIETVTDTDGVVEWNDYEGRSQSDVVATFNKAIEIAKSLDFDHIEYGECEQ